MKSEVWYDLKGNKYTIFKVKEYVWKENIINKPLDVVLIDLFTNKEIPKQSSYKEHLKN